MKQRLPLLIGLVALVAIVVVAVVMVNGKNKNTDMHMNTGTSHSHDSSSTDSSSGGDKPVATDHVTIQNFAFSPSSITVKAGTTVTWTNQDSTPHTVTVANNPNLVFDSSSLKQGDSYSMTFKKAGTYDYTCDFHPDMHGKVVVTD
jgi:amicyanin